MPETPRRSALALALLVPAPSLGVLAAMWLLPGTGGQIIYGVCKAWLVALPLLWLRAVEGGRVSWSPPRHGGLGVGLCLGVIVGAVIVAAYALWGDRLIDPDLIRAEAEENGIASPLRYLALAAYLCTGNALLEEYVWRWFVFRRCEELVASGSAAVLLSATMFTFHHVLALAAQFGWAMTAIGSSGVFVGGALWSWCYLRYRSIWPGFVSHLAVDITVLAIGWRLLFA